jgi:hypothetical protein
MYEKLCKELKSSEGRHRKFREDGKKIYKLYETDERSEFNILYANTELLEPALLSAPPKPVVLQRSREGSQETTIASKLLKRALDQALDTGDLVKTDFFDANLDALHDALLAGWGLTRVRFYPDGPQVCLEHVPWDFYLLGYARKWSRIPWVAFKHLFTEEEAKAEFPEVNLDLWGVCGSEEADEGEAERERPQLREAWEVWDKESRKVYFVSHEYDGVLREAEDPLGLEGFFPCGKPLMMARKRAKFLPIPLYKFYDAQAIELEDVTKRLTKLTQAAKIRGFFDNSVSGLLELLEADDLTMLPAESDIGIGEARDTSKWVYLVPIEPIISAIMSLEQRRESIKATIYELTGLSDIVRGASRASETLGAQQIKTQWGSLRLRRMQKSINHFVRDNLRLMAEVILKFYTPEHIAKLAGVQLPTQEMKFMGGMGVQALQGPERAAAEAAMSLPSYEELDSILKSPDIKFLVDIETDSTLEVDVTADKAEVAEFLNSVGQFLAGVTPLVESKALPLKTAMTILGKISRMYRFGNEIQEELLSIQEPEQEEDPAQQVEMQQKQAEMQAKQQELQMSMQEKQLDLQIAQFEAQAKRQEIELKMAESAMKAEHAAAAHAQRMAEIEAKKNATTRSEV